MTNRQFQDLTRFYLDSLNEMICLLSQTDAERIFLDSQINHLVFKNFSWTFSHQKQGFLFPPFSILPLLKDISYPLIAADLIGPEQLRTGIVSLGRAASFNSSDFYQNFLGMEQPPKICFWDIRRFDQHFPHTQREKQWHEFDKHGPILIPLLNFKAQQSKDRSSLYLELTVAFNHLVFKSFETKQSLISLFQNLIDLFQSSKHLETLLKPTGPFVSTPHFSQERDDWNNLFSEIKNDFFDKQAGKKIVLSSNQKWEMHTSSSFQNYWAFELSTSWASSELPSHHSFLMISSKGHAFYSKTPEKLFLIYNSSLYLEALAGTRSVGKNQQDDDLLEQELYLNPKERYEHQLVIDYFKNLFQKHNLIIGETTVLKLKNIQHLYTPLLIKDWKNTLPGLHFLLEELHPSPAVCGTPSNKAQQSIRENEGYDRGIYAGALTYAEGGGDLKKQQTHFAISLVGIRAQLEYDTTLFLYAGAGIMKDSAAHQEWSEIQKKVQSFFAYPELIPKPTYEGVL